MNILLVFLLLAFLIIFIFSYSKNSYSKIIKNSDTLNLEKEINWQAYRYWEEAGKPEGKGLEFWTKAENKCKKYFKD